MGQFKGKRMAGDGDGIGISLRDSPKPRPTGVTRDDIF